MGPLLQQVDASYLEELKRKAADEEAVRVLNEDPEADPKRINFHRCSQWGARRDSRLATGTKALSMFRQRASMRC